MKNVAEESRNYVEEHHTYPPALDQVLAKSNRLVLLMLLVLLMFIHCLFLYLLFFFF